MDEDERDIAGGAGPGPRSERVRIMGAERAGGPGTDEADAGTEPEEEAPFGPDDWALSDTPQLPHWTEAPTGEVPAVLVRRSVDDDPWSAVPEPSWREDRTDWDQEEPLAPSVYAGDEGSLRPLDEADLAVRQPWSFDLEEPHATPAHVREELDRSGEPEEPEEPPAAAAWRAWEDVGTGRDDEVVAPWADDEGPVPSGTTGWSAGAPARSPLGVGPDDVAGDATQIIRVPAPSVPRGELGLAEDPDEGGRRTWIRRRRPGGPPRWDRAADEGVDDVDAAPVIPGRAHLGPLRRRSRPEVDTYGADTFPAGRDTPVHGTPSLHTTDELPAVQGGAGDEAHPGRHPLRLHGRGAGRVGARADEPLAGRPPTAPHGEGRAEHQPSGRAGRNVPVAVATGLAVGIVALVFFHFGTITSMVVVTAVLTLAAMEAFAAFRRGGYRPATLIGLVAVVAVLVATYNKTQQAVPLVLVLLVAFTFLWHLAGVDRRADPVRSTAATILVFCWVGVFGSYAALLLAPSLFPHRHGIAYLLGALIAAVAYDIGALTAGAWLGRHPLSAASPNKTWEGLIGGAVVAIVVAVAIVHLIHPWTVGKAAVLGVVVCVVSPIGDLGESLVKRHLGLKDMGRMLPGHGGVLDRIDGLLFVLPATYYMLRAFHLG